MAQGRHRRSACTAQVCRQIEAVQCPFEDIRGQEVLDGQHFTAGTDPPGGIGEFGGPARGRTDVVEMEES